MLNSYFITMKPIPITENIAFSIDFIIDFFESFKQKTDYNNPFYLTTDKLAKELAESLDKLRTINILDIKDEFSKVCDGYDQIIPLRHIIEVNFKRLLSWRYNSVAEFTDQEKEMSDEIEEFLTSYYNDGNIISFENKDSICNSYILIGYNITYLKINLLELLARWQEMGAPFSKIDTDKNKSKPVSNSAVYTFKLASKKKTDFIKLLSSMYDTKMFVDADGKAATNKQKLMEAFGEFLGDDFSAYSASLSQAKTRDDKTFLKPFKEIEKEALRYFNQVGE